MAKIFLILSVFAALIASIHAGGPAAPQCQPIAGQLSSVSENARYSIVSQIGSSTDYMVIATAIGDGISASTPSHPDRDILLKFYADVMALPDAEPWFIACVPAILDALNSGLP